MERKIGEIFEYNGEWYQCVVAIQGCRGCSFRTQDYCTRLSECVSTERSDKKSVIFKKLEKVGEPYEFDGHLFQSYRIFEVPIFTENYATVRELGNNSKISIEIKQTKEDMEEKKIQHYDCFFDGKSSKSNLKPFDLKAAKAGKPVCTRDGAKARIICFDAKSDAPIIALITADDGTEITFDYLSDGTFFNSENPDNDLMMLPEKKEGWVNVYKGGLLDTKSYPTKKEALDKAGPRDYVDTIKISWEE